MATKAGKSTEKSAQKRGRPFTKEDAKTRGKVPGPGRTAGFKTWSAELFAHMLETPAGKDDQPFVIAALEKWKRNVLEGKAFPQADFIKMIFSPGMIEKVDQMLTGQKNADLAFLRYQIAETFFDEQLAVMHSKKSRRLLVCGRRSGKTHFIAGDGVSVGVSNTAGDILYMGSTHKSVFSIVWPVVIEYLKALRIPYQARLAEQMIELPSGVKMFFAGFHTRADIERWRGFKWRRVYIDEAQNCQNLKMLIEEVIEPGLVDYGGLLTISGTPPRVAGTYFERLWDDAADNKFMSRFTWDMSYNVHIPEHKTVLDEVLEKRGWDKNNQVYQREYLGRMGVYDYDALVYRLEAANFYEQKALDEWYKAQIPSDLFFVGGLDFGVVDSDAFCILLCNRKTGAVYVVHEYKAKGNAVSPLAEAIKQGLKEVRERFPLVPIQCNIYADTEGKKISMELQSTYGLPIVDAIKQNKELGISMLQDEIRAGTLKVKKDGIFADEARFIVFRRNDDDTLTREIDDDVYHGDMSDALLYARRTSYMLGIGGKKVDGATKA